MGSSMTALIESTCSWKGPGLKLGFSAPSYSNLLSISCWPQGEAPGSKGGNGTPRVRDGEGKTKRGQQGEGNARERALGLHRSPCEGPNASAECGCWGGGADLDGVELACRGLEGLGVGHGARPEDGDEGREVDADLDPTQHVRGQQEPQTEDMKKSSSPTCALGRTGTGRARQTRAS